MNYMIKTLGMFEFGSWKDAMSKAGKMPTTTKWVHRVKKDEHSSDVGLQHAT